MAPSYCAAANALLPHLAVGSAMLQPQHHPPPPFFVSLRLSLARRQCPFLGTTFWKGTNPRTYIFSLTVVPRTLPIIMDQCQLVTVFFFNLYLILCVLPTHLKEVFTNIRQAASMRQQRITGPAVFLLFLHRVNVC